MFSYGSLALILLNFLFAPLFSKTYTDDWIVHLEDHGDADFVAKVHGFENKGRIGPLEKVYHFKLNRRSRKHIIQKRGTREKKHLTDDLNSHHMIKAVVQDEILEIEKREDKIQNKNRIEKYNDPLWDEQWFLDPQASYDLQDDDSDPSPRYARNEPNRHGTRCAGEIAAVRNNSVCGVGVAFNAKIGGIRVLDGAVTRIMESKALGYNLNHIDIFSASWGPPDNGKSMDGPKGITAMVLDKAITEGRGGKGTIYVWAGGNGGKNDDCNADGYQTMRHSISISAVGMDGNTPYYAEPCAAALASTFSSGFVHSIATTDIHGKCTTAHSGTSAAAPIAAGIIALTLEANPNLTWRDVQHIIINAADPDKLFYHDGWVRNAANRATHINFGYGIMDATRMVEIAKIWTNVGDAHQCQSPKLNYNRKINAHEKVTFEIKFDGCEGTKNTVHYLEHVYLELNLTADKRGDISVQLKSPSFTNVNLMSTRIWDSDNIGFRDWRLMTVFLFGEDPKGTWTVTIKNEGKFDAKLNTMFLDVFGTEEEPMTVEHPSTDSNVCEKLCKLAGEAYYDSAFRCKKCKNVVKVDIALRELNHNQRSTMSSEA